MDSDHQGARGEDMVTEQWIMVCVDGTEDPAAAHGPFTDQHRAEIWAEQHEQDLEAGHTEKCPAWDNPIRTVAVRLEALGR